MWKSASLILGEDLVNSDQTYISKFNDPATGVQYISLNETDHYLNLMSKNNIIAEALQDDKY